VKLLFDADLSPALVARLHSEYPESTHEEHLQRLGKAGFAGSITADDQRETRSSVQSEHLRGTDSSKASDRERRQEDASLRSYVRGRRRLRRGLAVAQEGLERVLPVTRGKDRPRQRLLQQTFSLQSLLDEFTKLGVHNS
jgi:hypothetical protein